MIKLYDLEVSGNAYKARLLFSLLDMEHEIVPVDFMAGEHKSAEYLKLNAFGQIPVLVDGDTVLRDSHAILVYIARLSGREDWLPVEAAPLAKVMQWLATDANEIYHGPNIARLHDKFGFDFDVEQARDRSHGILRLFEAHLESREWLELRRPTIADISCLPYLALAPEGGVPLDKYPSVQAWIARIKALPGFVSMPGL